MSTNGKPSIDAEPPVTGKCSADLVLTGGKVVTLDPNGRIATAVAIQGDRIMAVGSDGEIAAEEGARRMGAAERFATRQGDAFSTLTALGEEAERFGLVICDPPAFAPAKPALEAGLRAYEKVARFSAPLVEVGGYLVLCSCSHAADLSSFTGACLRGIGRAGRRAQLIHTGFAGPDHPLMPQLAESGYLKALFFRL